MSASLPLLAGKRKTVFKGCLWCGNGALSVLAASLTPPLMKVIADGYHLLVELEDMGPAFQFCVVYWKKGQESRVSFTLGFLGSNREPTYLEWKHTDIAQGLFASPSSCCEAWGPAWHQYVPYSSTHTSGLLLPPWRSLSVLSTFPSLRRGITPGMSTIERNQKSGNEGVYADFLLWTSFGLLRPRLRCYTEVLTKFSQKFFVKQLAWNSEL